MPIKTHDESCYTKIIPTKCPDCSKNVYFFNCTHGSKVYFNIPEPPWDPHKDTCPYYLLKHLIKEEHVPANRLRTILINHAKKVGMVVPSKIYQELDRLDWGMIITEIHPNEKELFVKGKVVEVTIGFNFFSTFGLSRDSFGFAALGKLASTSFNELVLRMDTDKNNHCKQFRVYISQAEYNLRKIKHQSVIRVRLNTFVIPERKPVWVVDLDFVK